MSAEHTPGQLLELAKAAQRMPWETCETDVPFQARYAFKQAITADHYLEVLAQRDELLAALKEVADIFGEDWLEGSTQRRLGDKARAAIAKVEGGDL